MTREEAIGQLTRLRSYCLAETGTDDRDVAAIWKADAEALSIAIAALRGPTREQVEKMRGKFFQAGIDDVAQDTWRCSRCLAQEFGNIQGINFCPSCGAPMTDEAVDMVMERLEEVQNDQ